jgi:hypothetical protein
MTMDGRATILRHALLLTFAVTRASLWFRPNADFNVGAYNVHHLFTGVLLMAAAGMASASAGLRPRARDACAAVFGAGLALTLDEWIYLIVTDGTNASYWTAPSVVGGTAFVAVAWVWLYVAARWNRRPSHL